MGADRKTILWQSSSVARLEKWPMVRVMLDENLKEGEMRKTGLASS